MQAYVLKRTLSVVPALLGITVLVFLLLRLIPGDVVDQMLGAQNTITEGQRLSLRHFFGLDQPLPLQFWEWIRRVAVGDLGASFRTATPVTQLILSRLPVTLELTFLSMLIDCGDMDDNERGSLPRISGAPTIAHIENCDCACVSLIPSPGPR